MIKILLILSVIIVLLLGLLGITYKQSRANRSEAIRWEHNYKEVSDSVSRIQLTLREFKDQSTSREDSLLRKLRIKPKQVEKIIYIENKYINKDTNEVDLTPIHPIGTSPKMYMGFIKSIDCLLIEGAVLTSDMNAELIFTNITYTNEYTYIAYWKRRKWRLLGINTRIFGKKQGELEVTSTCGATQVKEIDIIKRK